MERREERADRRSHELDLKVASNERRRQNTVDNDQNGRIEKLLTEKISESTSDKVSKRYK